MVRRRQLARQLRVLRERAGLTLEVAAPELDWSSSKLSRIETGQQAVDVRRGRAHLSNAVAVRTIRQQRLTSAEGSIQLTAVVDEAALHRVIGSPCIHKAQLDHLITAAGLPTVRLHVLPSSIGVHGALASPLSILHFGDLGEPDLAYVEHSLGSMIVEKEADVSRAKLLFDRLLSDALSPADSVDLIKQLADRS